MKKVKSFALVMMICFVAVIAAACGSPGETTAAKGEPLSEEEIASFFASPNEFKGREITLTGKVTEGVKSYGDQAAFEVSCEWESYDKLAAVVCAPDLAKEVKADVFVRVNGVVYGETDEDNLVFFSLPQVNAEKVEVLSYKDAVAPTLKEVTFSDQSVDQHGCVIEVTKVEFAEKETRVYVKVANNSSAAVNISTYSAKITQNGSQFDCTDNWEADYDELQSNILPGISSEGVLVFDAIEQSDFTLVLSAFSEDWELDMEDYVFELSVKADNADA